MKPNEMLWPEWHDAHEEWGPGQHEDGFGLTTTDEVGTPSGFAAWVKRLKAPSIQCTYRWIVEGDVVLGGIALRHDGHRDVEQNGHLGYGVRPSARGRGLATWALREMLAEARRIGFECVVIVCQVDNIASAATIERCGGKMDDVGSPSVRRYRVTLA